MLSDKLRLFSECLDVYLSPHSFISSSEWLSCLCEKKKCHVFVRLSVRTLALNCNGCVYRHSLELLSCGLLGRVHADKLSCPFHEETVPSIEGTVVSSELDSAVCACMCVRVPSYTNLVQRRECIHALYVYSRCVLSKAFSLMRSR